jgi:hypothetical protein
MLLNQAHPLPLALFECFSLRIFLGQYESSVS